MAIFHSMQEALWLGSLLMPLHNLSDSPKIPVHVDNQESISLSANESINQLNKHMAIKYHFTRYQIRLGFISLMYCPTERMASDTLKKPLPKPSFLMHRLTICLHKSLD